MNFSRASILKPGVCRCYGLTAIIAALLYILLTRAVIAANVCSPKVAQVVSVQGIVELRRNNSTDWKPADLDTHLCAGDSLRVRKHSRAAIRLNNESLMRLDQRTAITIPQTEEKKATSLIDLIKGAIHIITRTPQPFKVRTPFLNASVEGTEFFVGVETDHARVVIYEGRVLASNDQGSLQLTDHEAAIAYQNRAPIKETIVRPLDAVQWALYYPAIIGYHRGPGNVSFDNQLHEAEYLLSVGQADEAKAIIDRILTADPDNSNAMALQSIIAVVQNDKEKALELAIQSIEFDKLSVPAWLALSYAQQAAFDIDAALASVKQAVVLDPQNALIWARLAELQMSVGKLEQALESAQEAVNLNPTVAKTQTVLGFAYLLQINTTDAKSIFHEAILLDQADPMPRLGLGLALIREGQLEAGRIELEIAASLDPGNSLIRSYLGKAYFEEKRYSTAETQFELAKERDPLDPTPWFYDAIQKQTQNRPVEALKDIQKSIELNDNRAVYRSRLLLDQDQAGRGSSLARIYDNLGFEKRALMETAKSLSFDPANHSAHRFLSDAYTNIPRHEIARVSELLQAQLLQPINVNPVQPHLAVADLNVITNTGPAETGFNEFASLVERNRAQLVASGIVGSNSTIGDEVVASALYDRASISVGQYHYDTNGFRANNDLRHNIYNAFMQYAITSKLNIQAEVRKRETEHGDLLLNFDLDDFDSTKRRKLTQDTARIGGRYNISQKQDLIFSASYINRKDDNSFIVPPIPGAPEIPELGSISTGRVFKDNAYLIETQYLFKDNRLNLIAGGGTYNADVKLTQFTEFLNTNEQLITSRPGFNRKRNNGYIYTNLNFLPNMNWTFGVSYTSFEAGEGRYKINKPNPKFGLQWDFTQNLRLRFAWFETIKSALVTNQTLEPTQVAGFNQFFDDVNGTKAHRIGIGLDTFLNKNIYGGIEISRRELDVPNFSDAFDLKDAPVTVEQQKENLYRAYLYLIPNTNWTIKSEPQFETFDRAIIINNNLPIEISTLIIPTSINYFNPSGVFAALSGAFVRQDIERFENFTTEKNSGISDFFMVDAVIGFRMPNRMGIISLEGKNLLNEEFSYRNINFQQSEITNTRFTPRRTFFARLTLNF
ncbi:MAG: TonB-dependent receptor [Nitrosomonas sp.]|nr:TonB-dependent receptor [Nitrosomonas sp.]